MKDDAILAELRAAAKRMDTAKTETPLDAPFDAAFEERAVARILRERELAVTKSAPRSRVSQRARALFRSPVTWTAFAAAAALVLFVTRGSWHPNQAPLPDYVVALAGGVDEMRGAPEARTSITASPRSPVAITLRPVEDVGGDVAVAVFGARGAEVQAAHATVRVAPTGAVEVKGRARDFVGDAPGEARILVTVSRAGVDPPTARAVQDGALPAGTKVTSIAVHVVPAMP